LTRNHDLTERRKVRPGSLSLRHWIRRSGRRTLCMGRRRDTTLVACSGRSNRQWHRHRATHTMRARAREQRDAGATSAHNILISSVQTPQSKAPSSWWHTVQKLATKT